MDPIFGWVYDPVKVETLRVEFDRARQHPCCAEVAILWGLRGMDLETAVRLGLAGHGSLMHGMPVVSPKGLQ